MVVGNGAQFESINSLIGDEDPRGSMTRVRQPGGLLGLLGVNNSSGQDDSSSLDLQHHQLSAKMRQMNRELEDFRMSSI